MREMHTAEEIRIEVARLLNRERKFPIEVPLPLRVMETDHFEGHGANWDMPKFKPDQARGNEAAIGRAIVAVKLKWNLKER
jgi:hypothetical protein